MKKFAICFCALLIAGSAFLCRGAAGRVREGVTVGGVAVGGMSYAEAERAVRAARPPFVLHTPEGDVLPEICYRDDVARLVRRARKGQTLVPEVQAVWVDAEQILEDVCEKCVRTPVDARLTFTAEGFMYTPAREGRWCDHAASLAAALGALAEGRSECSLVTRPWQPAVTEETLRARTRLLASFSTRFDPSKSARVHNIALACARIAGTALPPGESFSFNAAVGERTRGNGFLDAAVILDGQFVQGTGGGVCQASTTLMGAAVRAGLRVTESHAHSLSVGYVPPSQDAMVSSASDLRFVNPHPFPVYILGRAEKDAVTFEIFGCPDGRRYALESAVLSYIEPPPAEVVEGEEGVVRAARRGLRSESYLVVYGRDGREERRTLFRRDRYAPVQGILSRPAPPQKEGGEGEENL